METTCRESFNMFLEKDNEIKLVPVSFSDVLELFISVMVITVIISLHYKETN